MELISRNSDYVSINLADSGIIALENSQKDHLHLGKAIKYDDRKDFIKAMRKEIKYLTTEDVW